MVAAQGHLVQAPDEGGGVAAFPGQGQVVADAAVAGGKVLRGDRRAEAVAMAELAEDRLEGGPFLLVRRLEGLLLHRSPA